MPELNTQDYTNIFAIIIVIIIVLSLGRVVINFTRTLFRMGCLIVLVAGGIYALWMYFQI